MEKNIIICDVHERNILTVLIDEQGQLLVEKEPVELRDLSKIAFDFLDNVGHLKETSTVLTIAKGKEVLNLLIVQSKLSFP